MADPALVPAPTAINMHGQLPATSQSQSSVNAGKAPEAPPAAKNETWRLPCVRESFQSRG